MCSRESRLLSCSQYTTHWELSALRMRTATLDAENEALRSHVSQLQEQIALLCEDLQVKMTVLDRPSIPLPAAQPCSLHPGLIVLPLADRAVACVTKAWVRHAAVAQSSSRFHHVIA